MKKKVLVIFSIYILLSIATSCDECDCEPSKTFERTYYGTALTPWNTSGFRPSEVLDSVYKNSFGLTISVLYELNQVAHLNKKKNNINLGNFGFSSAYACSCVLDEYINADPMDSIKITATNTETQGIIDVTDNFTMQEYDGHQTEMSELFENSSDWDQDHEFRIDMTKYDNIPNSSIFTVTVFLESGTELTKQTQKINFK